MGLCCVEMVRAKAAGVAFSRHPVDLRSNATVINGLWGLGEMVVDGSGTPDQWLVSRATKKITMDVRLFAQWPALHELRVQLVTPAGQHAAELTGQAHQLSWLRQKLFQWLFHPDLQPPGRR